MGQPHHNERPIGRFKNAPGIGQIGRDGVSRGWMGARKNRLRPAQAWTVFRFGFGSSLCLFCDSHSRPLCWHEINVHSPKPSHLGMVK